MRLRNFVPREFFLEYLDTKAAKLLDREVVNEYGYTTQNFRPWPGPHKNVHSWVTLEGGYAVGWNESPSRGWSFPVVKINENKT